MAVRESRLVVVEISYPALLPFLVIKTSRQKRWLRPPLADMPFQLEKPPLPPSPWPNPLWGEKQR